MGQTAVFDLARVTLTVAGRTIEGGFTKGECIIVEKATELYTVKVGGDGQVARAKSNDKTHTVKIKLMSTSLGNDVLQQVMELDAAAPNGSGIGAVTIVDGSSGVRRFHAEHGWVHKLPPGSIGDETTDNEWLIMTADGELNLSGAPSV